MISLMDVSLICSCLLVLLVQLLSVQQSPTEIVSEGGNLN